MSSTNNGIVYAFLSYVIWGAFPLFWKLLYHVNSLELLLGRIIWAFIFTLIMIVVVGQSKKLMEDFVYLSKHKMVLLKLIGAAFVISLNWFLYIFAVTHDYLVQTSLGYYINPLLSVLFGVMFFKEKLSNVQIVATMIACMGVFILTFNYGSFPWIAIFIAISFAIYGVLKKQIPIDATRGLAIETFILLPVALILYTYIWIAGEPSFLHVNWQTDVLMMLGGIITAIPLILFAKGAQQIPLYLLGFLQYVSPTLILIFGVVLYGEPFTRIELIAFCIIWFALLIFSGTMFLESRQSKYVKKAS